MNKLVFLLALALLAIATVSNALAAPLTLVTGVVSDGDGNPVVGATVDTSCNGFEQSTSTDADGKYYIFYPALQCDEDDLVTVTATFGEDSGSNTGVVNFSRLCKINTAIINVTIPEFGVVAAIGALVAGLGIVIYRRKD